MKRPWKQLCLFVLVGTLLEGCQNSSNSTNPTTKKPFGQRLFGTLGDPARPGTPNGSANSLPSGVPNGSVLTPPPGAIILDANGQPLPPGMAPPPGTVVPANTFGIPGNPSPSFGGNPPLGFGGNPPLSSSIGAGTPLVSPPSLASPPSGVLPPLPPAVTTNPPPSSTGAIQSESKRFSNEEMQNSVRLGIPGSSLKESSAKAKVETAAPKAEPAVPLLTGTPSPLDIPRFVKVKNGLAFGRQPFPDGIVWLKQAGFKKVVHIAGSAELDDAAQRLFEREGIQYISLEVLPENFDAALVTRFAGAFADAETTPVFIYDRDGSRLGSLWMAHRVLNEKVTLSQAKSEAESLGFHYEKTATLDPVRKALDKLLPAF